MGCTQAMTAVAARPSPQWEPAVATPLQVPLQISNRAKMSRLEEPVTSGIPLPKESGITSVDQLQITDAQGGIVAAQFRVLSRWGPLEDPKAPIKWVLVDLQSTVPAGGTVTYSLRQGTKPGSKSRMEVSDEQSVLQVHTGSLVARIRKQGGALLDQISMAHTNGNRPQVPADALLSGPIGLRVEKPGGPFRSAIAKTGGVQLEEQGALRTVVRLHGTFRNAQGIEWVGGDARPGMQNGRPPAEEKPLEFVARLTFFAQKSYFKLTVTLQNNGNSLAPYYPVNDAFFDGLYVDVPWRMEEPRRVAFPEHDEMRAVGREWALTQSHEVRDPVDENANFIRKLIRDGKPAKSGRRAAGWAALCDDAHCGWVGVRAFWQNYPKSLEVSPSRVAIGLWPAGLTKPETGDYGRGNYFFSGGWHKTHEMFLSFVPAQKEPFKESLLLETPLFAVVPPAWHAETRAWSLIGPAGLKPADATTQEAIDRYEQFRQILIDPKASDDGVTIEQFQESRGLAATRPPGIHFNLDLYGWEAFGELPWGSNGAGFYSALHYDWPFIMWLQFIRSGDLRYLPVALTMTDHSTDLDQIHYSGSSSDVKPDGIWWWEQLIDVKRHHRATQMPGLIISHTWNGGYSLGYLLTGNPLYREAAEAGAYAGRRFWFDQNKVSQTAVAFDQTRSQGWSILMLINLYRLDGRSDHLRDALMIFKNSLLYTEQLPTIPGSNGRGFITHNNPAGKDYHGTAVITFLTYPLEPLSELHYEASQVGLDIKDLEAYLIRSLDWLKDFAYVGGTRNKTGGYSPLTLSYATNPNDKLQNQGGETAHNIHVAAGFAYGYRMLKDKEPQKALDYLAFARALFRDLMFYRQIGGLTRDKFIDSKQRGPVNLGWPGTATKELGWISRSGGFYLHAEYLLSKRNESP